jgi:hypothetical protein
MLVVVAVLIPATAAQAEPAWGTNCMSCHGDLLSGAIVVYGEDTTADPDESGTGAPDRGTLKVFEVVHGQAKTLLAAVQGLDPDDTYAVELKRLRFDGVVHGAQLGYSPDCDWAEWKQPGDHYTDPAVAYQWGTDPQTFAYDIDVEENGAFDYYDLVVAVAGKLAQTGGLFYAEEHFYLRVTPLIRPGDIDEDGDVDLNDFATFALCFHGSAVTTPPAGCTQGQFDLCDVDDDADVDLADYATFALNFTG